MAIEVGFVSVADVAKFMEFSERRVRKLLADRRMGGFKNPEGVWQVSWPLQISPGRRGPQIRRYPVRGLRIIFTGFASDASSADSARPLTGPRQEG